jgi:HEAT repeat protein
MRDHECKETLRKMLEDPSEAVRETAFFVLKRLDRLTQIVEIIKLRLYQDINIEVLSETFPP